MIIYEKKSMKIYQTLYTNAFFFAYFDFLLFFLLFCFHSDCILKLYKNVLLIGLSNCRLVGTNKAPAFKQSVLDFQLVAWITY